MGGEILVHATPTARARRPSQVYGLAVRLGLQAIPAAFIPTTAPSSATFRVPAALGARVAIMASLRPTLGTVL